MSLMGWLAVTLTLAAALGLMLTGEWLGGVSVIAAFGCGWQVGFDHGPRLPMAWRGDGKKLADKP